MDVIDRIFMLINENGLNAAVVSRATGIKQATFSQWKKRLQQPSSENVQILASYFNVSTDYLLGNEQKEKTSPQLSDEAIRLGLKLDKLSRENKELVLKLIDSMIVK